MRILGLISAAAVCAALSGAALAETQAERDARRTGYVNGFSCSMVVRGQPIVIRYREGGIGRMEWQEDDVALEWRIEKDQFCVKVTAGREKCSTLRASSPPDEEAEFMAWLSQNCL